MSGPVSGVYPSQDDAVKTATRAHRRWTLSVTFALGAAVASLGCGVAGRPLPPGPVPPAAPTVTSWRATPTAIEVRVEAPTRDIDGQPIVEPLLLTAHRATDCSDAPIAHGPTGRALQLPPLPPSTPIRVVAARGARRGPPSAPVALGWVAPPAAPEAPLAFVDGQGQVQLSWLPPEAPRVRILRDGVTVAEVDSALALYSDAAPVGRHRYQLVGVGPQYRTAPSASVSVEVPRR